MEFFTKPISTSFSHPVETCFACLKSNTVLSTSCRDSVWTVSMATVHDGQCWCPTSWGEVINMCRPSDGRQVERLALFTLNVPLHTPTICAFTHQTPAHSWQTVGNGVSPAHPRQTAGNVVSGHWGQHQLAVLFFFKEYNLPLKGFVLDLI